MVERFCGRLIINIDSTNLDTVLCIVPREICALVPRDRKKDEFMSLETMVAYEDIFHAYYHYATKLVKLKKDMVFFFIKSLNFELQVLSL